MARASGSGTAGRHGLNSNNREVLVGAWSVGPGQRVKSGPSLWSPGPGPIETLTMA